MGRHRLSDEPAAHQADTQQGKRPRQARGKLAFGTPKTPVSERTIPLHQTAIKLLTDILNSRSKTRLRLGQPMRTTTLSSAPGWADRKTPAIWVAPSIEFVTRRESAAYIPIVCVTRSPPEEPKTKLIFESCSVSLDTPISKRQQAPIPMCWATSNGMKCRSWRMW